MMFPFVLVAAVAVFAGLINFGLIVHVPGYSELSDIRHHEASSVYTSDGVLLGRYYLQNRDEITLDEIAPEFINALIAIEDIRFYEHSGVDYRAMARVAVRTLLLRENAGGGSTISQQLAKNLYPRKSHGRVATAVYKFREIIVARRIERLYSKEEVLELYLNTVSFGEDTWGIKTASERFFNTTPDRLELHQAATLAGMLRATTWYNPRRNPDNALERRNLVLYQMYRYDMIPVDTMQAARARPLDLDYHRWSQGDGRAPHFRQFLKRQLEQILETQPALDGKAYHLHTDGLAIETTIDSRLQSAAEYAVTTTLSELQTVYDGHRDHLPVFDREDPMVRRAWQQSGRYQRMKDRGLSGEMMEEMLDRPVPMELFTWEGMEPVTASPRDSILHYLSLLNSGFVAMRPSDGAVLAWVGSIDYEYFQYDHVRARRPTGSAFKPVVYATALEQGMKPCDYRRNLLSTYMAYSEWTPTNLEEEYGGYYSLQAALSRSVNTIAVELAMESGIEEVRETARRMGVQSYIPARPSIALGSAEMTLLELTQAYTTFVNRGTPATPRYIKAIYNSDRELIYDFTATEAGPAVSEETAAAMVGMLSRTVDSGSARALRTRYGIQHALAGKTGTSQYFTDGWFIGMTPDMVFGSWVGGASLQVQLPESIGFASRNALPVAGLFLQELGRNPDLAPIPGQFHPYQQNTSMVTDCEDYRDARFTDRVRDFFTGRDTDEAQIIDDDQGEESGSLLDRVRGWFRNRASR